MAAGLEERGAEVPPGGVRLGGGPRAQVAPTPVAFCLGKRPQCKEAPRPVGPKP